LDRRRRFDSQEDRQVLCANFRLRTLAIEEKLSPSSLEVGWVLGILGDLTTVRELPGPLAPREIDWARAEQYYGQSLAILEKPSPNTPGDTRDLIRVLHGMALALRQKGQRESAASVFAHLLEAIDQDDRRMHWNETFHRNFSYYND
jgi:hypothetical protein